MTEDGAQLGERSFAALSWSPGDVIPLGRASLEVVEVRDGDPPTIVVRSRYQNCKRVLAALAGIATSW